MEVLNKKVEVKELFKQMDGKTILDHISFDVYEGEFLSVLGPSGCGKTTLLRMIAGFNSIEGGDI